MMSKYFLRSCLTEDTSHIWVREEELAGVPQDLVSTFERRASGELKVITKVLKYNPRILGNHQDTPLPCGDKEVLSAGDQVQD